ncbi:hypothetical protein MSG84_06745 [Acinetobacter baumannii]|uniref:hypothetical protein n=2 Tax=Acinetobacter baumannii TaxID=470 RepID=UPI001058127E|nr:hypothetical protein [Acinetobacter baumannii]MDV4220918.1 hypothetical protein [Acinetobacter baumannii]QBM38585.1 hypothetical protein E1A85_16485 [Acinetobacter baumannii]
MFVYFTDGTCINDSEIYGVKAKYEQNKYVVEVTIKPTHVLATIPSVQFKKEVFDDPNLANQYLSHNFNMPPFFLMLIMLRQ